MKTQKINSQKLFRCVIVLLILGFSLIGWGIGMIFPEKLYVGLIVGIGVGLVLASIVTFKVLQNMQIYKKTEL